jgi:hypothetical protein
MSSDDWRIAFFSQLYEDLTDQSVDHDDTRRSLEASGVDVDATVTEGLKLIADHEKRMRLVEAKEKLARLRKIVSEWSAQPKESLDSALEDVARALAGDIGGPAYQAYHRKLESYTSDDLASFKEDADLIEFLHEIEADEGIQRDT